MSKHLPPEPAASAASDPSPRDVPARRRFVRGVFAAPAVMTVCSGSAYANLGSLTCLERGQGKPDPLGVETFLTGSEGNAVFFRAVVYEKDGVNYVSYADLDSIGSGASRTEIPGSPGDYLELSTSGSPPSGNLTGKVRSHSLVAADNPTQTNARVVVRMDGRGHVVGTGGANGAGALVSSTCWMSFNGVNR